MAKCKNETANQYEQDTVCTNAGLTKPTCATPKTYNITPSITDVTEGTHIEIRLEVKDSSGNSANLPDNESFVMYFKYQYQYGNSTYSGTTSKNGNELAGWYTFSVGGNRWNMTNAKILDAGFNSSFTKQIEYWIDTYIMNQPEVKISPECGNDANGWEFSFKPSDQLCAVGTASSVSGSGPWTWTCSNDGETSYCSANKKSSSKYYLEVWFNPENRAWWLHDQELQIFYRNEDGQIIDSIPDTLNMNVHSPESSRWVWISLTKASGTIYKVKSNNIIGDVSFSNILCEADDNWSDVCTIWDNEYYTYLCNTPANPYQADPSCISLSSSAWL